VHHVLDLQPQLLDLQLGVPRGGLGVAAQGPLRLQAHLADLRGDMNIYKYVHNKSSEEKVRNIFHTHTHTNNHKKVLINSVFTPRGRTGMDSRIAAASSTHPPTHLQR
jgi:hypothetical protein